MYKLKIDGFPRTDILLSIHDRTEAIFVRLIMPTNSGYYQIRKGVMRIKRKMV